MVRVLPRRGPWLDFARIEVSLTLFALLGFPEAPVSPLLDQPRDPGQKLTPGQVLEPILDPWVGRFFLRFVVDPRRLSILGLFFLDFGP